MRKIMSVVLMFSPPCISSHPCLSHPCFAPLASARTPVCLVPVSPFLHQLTPLSVFFVFPTSSISSHSCLSYSCFTLLASARTPVCHICVSPLLFNPLARTVSTLISYASPLSLLPFYLQVTSYTIHPIVIKSLIIHCQSNHTLVNTVITSTTYNLLMFTQ